ncbi:MAG: methylenetetrahydrofolate reductase [Clostridia bacterium]|nr:methylenetetrahydrofolate reductase [NAD(P)H] [Clostridia bacterium]
MNLQELFTDGRQRLSFEIFPPKRDGSIESVFDTVEQLAELSPAFISVTYGANGSGARGNTVKIADAIKNKFGMLPVAHLTCINHDREEIDLILDNLSERGVENVLALRGDRNPEVEPKTDFSHASDLVAHIKKRGGFFISGACYPETHPEARDAVADVLNLKKKVDAGAGHLISQLFFDNSSFYSFVERCRIAGINVPIEAGIMPVTNAGQIKRMVTLCGASLPAKFSRIISRYGDDPEALEDAGIAYATDQIVDLLTNGVQGIHLYTMNKPELAKKIVRSVEKLFRK